MLQNLEGSEESRVHPALCTYWRQRMYVHHTRMAWRQTRGYPTRRANSQDGRQCGQVHNALSVTETGLHMNSIQV